LKNRSFPARLRFAMAGILCCWKSERSFRTHICFAVAAALLLALLRPPAIWWAVVSVISALVLALEMVNSALERLIDHLHPDIHPEIRLVKDMAAGAVLLASAGAVIVGAALLVTLI
jgi:undecaprenol kinase